MTELAPPLGNNRKRHVESDDIGEQSEKKQALAEKIIVSISHYPHRQEICIATGKVKNVKTGWLLKEGGVFYTYESEEKLLATCANRRAMEEMLAQTKAKPCKMFRASGNSGSMTLKEDDDDHDDDDHEESVLHQNASEFGTQLALANVLRAPVSFKEALILAVPEIYVTKIPPFVEILETNFKFTLEKVKQPTTTVEWICAQSTGKYLLWVQHYGHVISVDCQKGVIFDCGRAKTLPLMPDSFTKKLKVKEFDAIRKIEISDKRLYQLEKRFGKFE